MKWAGIRGARILVEEVVDLFEAFRGILNVDMAANRLGKEGVNEKKGR